MKPEVQLAILTAIIVGAQFVGKRLFLMWEKQTQKRLDAKIAKEISEVSDTVKAKEIFDKLTELNKKEVDYNNRETNRLMANNMSVLINQNDASFIIDDVIKNTDVNRFVLFHTHNGNGQPNYFKPYKVSYLQYNALNPSVINKYQNIEVDSDYTKMLIEIQENEGHFVKRVVAEMEKGLLKTIYLKESIKYSEIYFLCATNTGIIYTSIATTEDVKNYDNDRLDISLAISKLKLIFENERRRVFRDAIEREENETRLKEVYIEKQKIKSTLN